MEPVEEVTIIEFFGLIVRSPRKIPRRSACVSTEKNPEKYQKYGGREIYGRDRERERESCYLPYKLKYEEAKKTRPKQLSI